MISLDIKDLSLQEVQYYLQNAVAPRPIALASTVNNKGEINLSPFSYFNCFSANPPILVFAPLRRVRDNTTKDTLEYIKEVGEVVVNTVDYNIVDQMSLSSTEYETGINEFIKSGLTPGDSKKIKPPYVAESPVAFECVVNDIIELGDGGGAGNLIIAEVVYIHLNDKIATEDSKIDLDKLDLVARMGGNWYCRTTERFEIPKPLRNKGIGVDAIPDEIRFSEVLTGNDLGRLGNIERLPTTEEIQNFSETIAMQNLNSGITNPDLKKIELHRLAQKYLAEMKIEEAWKTLLQTKS
ncbi:flavin reductase family protein [Neptunitalea lumnitzerae]|uniref:Flavin reductase n=1 Tax=Neptunitalea lumnitzerae TaxID=2965509 RepID=A0ABQ5MJB2_9FLAO|nr:flavin reductase family protein [Neptunitalea sp. Y10]GLB49493.1 flavin reductase [Neptunitalea sp. Y10]